MFVWVGTVGKHVVNGRHDLVHALDIADAWIQLRIDKEQLAKRPIVLRFGLATVRLNLVEEAVVGEGPSG